MSSGVMVTGSGGFIGQPLVRRLRELGFSVSEVRGRSDCDMGDLCALRRRIDEFEPDVIIHLAATADDGWKGSAVDLNTVAAVRNLALAIRSSACHVIHVGSYKQYGDVKLPFRETDEVNPVTRYGHSKHLAEKHLCYSEGLGAFRLTSLRLGPVFGPGQNSRSLVARLIDSCSRQQSGLHVGVRPWDPLYIDDAVDAIIAVLRSERCIGGTFNASGGIETSPALFAQIVGAEFGLPKDVIRELIPVSDSLGWGCLGDISRIVTTTGWRPRFSHEDGVRRTVQAFNGATLAHRQTRPDGAVTHA